MSRRPRIAVFGSVHMDLIVHAVVLPEKAQSGLAHGFNMGLGGKGGNQAVECARSGADVFMTTQLGDDEFGHRLLAWLKDRSVDCSAITLSKTIPSGCSTVLSAPEGYTSLIFPGAAAAQTEAEVAGRIAALAPFDMLLLQLELPVSLSLAAAEAAKATGARVVLNPSPPPAGDIDALLALTSLLVVNKVEANAIAGTHDALKLAQQVGCDVVVTLGADGCLASDGREVWTGDATKVDVKSTVGAGDAFLAGLCVALCKGQGFAAGLNAARQSAARKLASQTF